VSSVDKTKVNRRAMLLGVVVLLGGAGALTRFSRKEAGEAAGAGPVLSAQQFALLEEITDVMIPATDTPGARAAGVPAFIRQMLTEWASPESHAQIIDVLEGVEKFAWARFGAAFVELQPERRHQLVRSFDEDRMSRQDPAYSKFKFLVLLGYYHSEIGATQELRYELIPGAWRSCVPLSEIGRATPV
jgi:gluconate 2-dehydrogenase gamma chain